MVRYVTMVFLLVIVSVFAEVRYKVEHRGNETIFRQYYICYTPDGKEVKFFSGCPDGYLDEKPKGKAFKLLNKIRKCHAEIVQKCLPECKQMNLTVNKKRCAEKCYMLLGTCVDGVLGSFK